MYLKPHGVPPEQIRARLGTTHEGLAALSRELTMEGKFALILLSHPWPRRTDPRWSFRHKLTEGMVRSSSAAFRCGHQNFEQGTVMSALNSSEATSLLTLKQAASRLTVCRRTLERMIQAGQFPRPVKIGRSSRVLESDVRAFMDKLLQTRQSA